MDYDKLTPADGLVYKRVKHYLDQGMWVCDSRDHNSDDGCSNPDCFNYKFRKQERKL